MNAGLEKQGIERGLSSKTVLYPLLFFRFHFRGFDVIENSHHGARCRLQLPPQPRDGKVPFIR